MKAAVAFLFVLAFLTAGALCRVAYAAGCDTAITAPMNGMTVNGTVPVSASNTGGGNCTHFHQLSVVNGAYNQTYNFTGGSYSWDSTAAPDGSTTLTVLDYTDSTYTAVVTPNDFVPITVTVQNHMAAGPTPPSLGSTYVIVAKGAHPMFNTGGQANSCTTAGNDSTDDTSCIQKVINLGDHIAIMPGVYKVGNGGSTNISVPSGTIMLGCTDPAGNCSSTTANYNPQGGTVAFDMPATGNVNGYAMFNIFGTSNSTFYGIQFREKNYNNTSSQPACDNFNAYIFNATGSGSTDASNNTWNFNDFNGPIGYNGAIGLESDTANDTNRGDTISYNSFEHCGNRGIEITDSVNANINHNTTVDCGDAAESLNYAPTGHMTGNVWDTESVIFAFGQGNGRSGCPAGDGNTVINNNLSGGIACHSVCPYDYSGNTVQNSNVCAGTSCGLSYGNSNTIGGIYLKHAAEDSKPANYINNTVSGNATMFSN